MKDLTDAISLEKAFPLTDEAGADTTPYKFKVTNTCNTGIDYNVNIEVLSTSTMAAKNIAVKLDNENKVVLLEQNKTDKIETTEYAAKEAYHISQGKLEPNESKEHEIRIWMDESAGNDAQKGTFSAKVVINGVQNNYAIYKEPLLHGADPVITGDLVPVIIEEDGKVLKANEHFNWYCYEDKEWANAVILVDKTQKYEYYEEIPENNIESYFVWIPKYRYNLFDEKLGDYQTATSIDANKQNKVIEIEFGLEDTIDDETNEFYKQCATPMNDDKTQGLSGESGECNPGEWMTHPAFISFDVNGLWVGKFETGNNNSKVQIKPNVTSWRNITISNSFSVSKSYKTTLFSHLMKNTEWGAVAYLTQSQYGTCSETICNEVAPNKNVSYTTGYNISTAYPKSQTASTTGNNTGIFDMNGRVWEVVMSVMANGNGSSEPSWGSSELNGATLNDKKYYDVYNYGTDYQHWERRILGDATGEMGPFQTSGSSYISSYFSCNASFVCLQHPWFYRGGIYYYVDGGNIFAFLGTWGDANELRRFRIVLAPQEPKS